MMIAIRKEAAKFNKTNQRPTTNEGDFYEKVDSFFIFETMEIKDLQTKEDVFLWKGWIFFSSRQWKYVDI